MSTLDDKDFGIEGYFIGNIYKNGYSGDCNNPFKNIVPNQLFLLAFKGRFIEKTPVALFHKNPWHIIGEYDSERGYYKKDSYVTNNSDYDNAFKCINDSEAVNKHNDLINLMMSFRFLDEETVNETFKPSYGDPQSVARQLHACKSILTLASIIEENGVYNQMINENKKAIRQYIKLFQENPETIKRIFEAGKDFEYYFGKTTYFDGITQELCDRVEEETNKLAKKLSE